MVIDLKTMSGFVFSCKVIIYYLLSIIRNYCNTKGKERDDHFHKGVSCGNRYEKTPSKYCCAVFFPSFCYSDIRDKFTFFSKFLTFVGAIHNLKSLKNILFQ